MAWPPCKRENVIKATNHFHDSYRSDIDEADSEARDADDPGDEGLVPVGPAVADDGDDTAGETGGGTQAEGDQHQEEQDREQLGQCNGGHYQEEQDREQMGTIEELSGGTGQITAADNRGHYQEEQDREQLGTMEVIIRNNRTENSWGQWRSLSRRTEQRTEMEEMEGIPWD